MRLGRVALAGGSAAVVIAIGWLATDAWLADQQIATNPVVVDDVQLDARGPVGPTDDGWRVSRVVDGDTIHVVRNGQDVKVRLIGIDTPETVKPNAPVDCYGPQASQFASDVLDGRQVVLEYDPSQGMTDRYDRTLAYVWVKADRPGGELRLFNLDAVRGGFAREATYGEPYAWQSTFRLAEQRAQAEDRGMWGACDGS